MMFVDVRAEDRGERLEAWRKLAARFFDALSGIKRRAILHHSHLVHISQKKANQDLIYYTSP